MSYHFLISHSLLFYYMWYSNWKFLPFEKLNCGAQYHSKPLRCSRSMCHLLSEETPLLFFIQQSTKRCIYPLIVIRTKLNDSLIRLYCLWWIILSVALFFWVYFTDSLLLFFVQVLRTVPIFQQRPFHFSLYLYNHWI